MTRTTHTATEPLYLHFHGIEEELDAIWAVEIETYPAEPAPWGAGRGMETEIMGALLISWHRHGQEYDRSDAVAIGGEADVIRQEEALSDTFELGETMPLFDRDDFGDWLRDQQCDRDDDHPALRVAAE